MRTTLTVIIAAIAALFFCITTTAHARRAPATELTATKEVKAMLWLMKKAQRGRTTNMPCTFVIKDELRSCTMSPTSGMTFTFYIRTTGSMNHCMLVVTSRHGPSSFVFTDYKCTGEATSSASITDIGMAYRAALLAVGGSQLEKFRRQITKKKRKVRNQNIALY